MTARLQRLIEKLQLRPEQITQRTSQIHSQVIEASPYIAAPNFTSIHPSDLQRMFDLYDQLFFRGRVKECLGDTPLRFGLSKRMTSSGGTTTRLRERADRSRVSYEIKISTALLYQCFAGDDHRPIVSSGITCRDRVDALQRTFEHEIIHLIEMLLWNESSCSKTRFHSITLRFFGHTEYRHQMITPRERALVKFGIRPGMPVTFEFEGVRRVGVVSRVTKRATVLVEDSQGEPYSNGKRYTKFYVPVSMLQVANEQSRS